MHENPEKIRPLKSTEAACLLDCSPDHVLAWARAGKLSGKKHGKYWRFRIEDVLKFKENMGREA